MERVDLPDRTARQLARDGDRAVIAHQFSQAERSYRGALARLPANERTVARAQLLYILGTTLNLQNQSAPAENALLEAEDIFTEQEGLQSLRRGLCLSALGLAQQRQGQYVKAEVTAQAAYDLFEAVLAPSDPKTLQSLEELTGLFARQQEFAQLIEFLLPRMPNIEAQPQVSETLKGVMAGTLGIALVQQGRFKEAQTYSLQALAHFQKVTPLPTEDIARAEALTGRSLLLSGKPAEAEAYVQRAMTHQRDLGKNELLAQTAFLLGHTLYAQGQRAPALDWYTLGLSTLASLSPQGNARADELQGQFGLFLCSEERDLTGWPESAKRCSDAERLVKEALTYTEQRPQFDLAVSQILEYLGLILQREQNFCEAERSFSRALTLRQSEASSATRPSVVKLEIELGMAQFAQGKLAQAKASFNTALAAAREEHYPPDASIARAQQRLAAMLYSEGQIKRAEGATDSGDVQFMNAILDGSALHDPSVVDNSVMSDFVGALINYSKGKYQAADKFAQNVQYVADDGHRSGAWVLSTELRAEALRQAGQHEQARAQHTQVSELCASSPATARQACALVQRPAWFKPCPRCRGTRGASALELMKAMDALNWRIDQHDWAPAQGRDFALCAVGDAFAGLRCATDAPWDL